MKNITIDAFMKEMSENLGGGVRILVANNHHRVVSDKPQKQSADYVLCFDSFKDMTFSAEKQHFTISKSNINAITIENNPEGFFNEEECFKIYHLQMKSDDIISVGIYEI